MLTFIIMDGDTLDKSAITRRVSLVYNAYYMHQKKSKRRQRAQLVFVYTLMTCAVVAIVAVLVLILLGYRFNRYDGKVEQGGLVQFDSRPAGATVMLNTIQLANRTPSKITASAGQHTVTLKRDGYNQWQKDVVVKPGAVLWLNYARMLPVSLQHSTVAKASTISSMAVSPNKKYLAYTSVSTSPTVTFVAVGDDTPAVTTMTLPSTSYTAPPEGTQQSFAVLSWDKDNQWVLVQHSFGDTSEYLVLDRRDTAQVQNISTLLGVSAKKALFSYADSNILYVLTTTNEVRQANIAAKTLSGPLLSNVADFQQFDRSTLTYDTLPDAAHMRHVGYLTVGASKPKVVRSQAASKSSFLLRFGRYYNTNYALITSGETTEVLTGTVPPSDSQDTLTLKRLALLPTAQGADYAGFSPGENRFAYVQKGAQLVTYDLELLQPATLLFTAAPTRAVDWVDGYHVASSVGGSARFADFDGTNDQIISVKDSADLPIFIASGDKYIYHVATTTGGSALVRTKLLVD